MSAVELNRDLQAFAVELFEHSGGIADWPALEAPGTVVIPAWVAKAANLPGEEFLLDTVTAPGTLQVGLTGEFLDAAARLLDLAVPRDGAFSLPMRHLAARDLADKVDQTFAWQNARAKCQVAQPALIEYHQWTLHGSLQSEDVWESIIRVAVNAESQAVVQLPDLFQETDLQGDNLASATGELSTYAAAIAEGKQRLIAESASFVSRIEQRLERDRKRLRDYYQALSRQADGSKRRTAAAPSADEIAAKKQAVDLELRRKLAELNEHYAMQAVLRPVVVARVRLPVLVVTVAIQRKQAIREYKLYWNSLLKRLEPLSCSRCRKAVFSAKFTNESVDLLCMACAESM